MSRRNLAVVLGALALGAVLVRVEWRDGLRLYGTRPFLATPTQWELALLGALPDPLPGRAVLVTRDAAGDGARERLAGGMTSQHRAMLDLARSVARAPALTLPPSHAALVVTDVRQLSSWLLASGLLAVDDGEFERGCADFRSAAELGFLMLDAARSEHPFGILAELVGIASVAIATTGANALAVDDRVDPAKADALRACLRDTAERGDALLDPEPVLRASRDDREAVLALLQTWAPPARLLRLAAGWPPLEERTADGIRDKAHTTRCNLRLAPLALALREGRSAPELAGLPEGYAPRHEALGDGFRLSCGDRLPGYLDRPFHGWLEYRRAGR